ncbi:MAG: S41 family peptidase [Bacteroidota bacterium]
MKQSLLLLALILTHSLYAQTLTFSISDYPTLDKQRLGIRGNTPPLAWDQSIFLDENDQVQLNFEAGVEFVEYKFVLEDKKGQATWELSSDGNRNLYLKSELPDIIEHQWSQQRPIDIENLPLIQPEQLLEDLALFKKAILEINPASYRYQTQADWDSAFRATERYFASPRTYTEAYLQFSQLVVMVRCGHTLVNQLNQHPLVKEIVMNQTDKLPFAFVWIDQKMIVTQSATDTESIQAGTEVLSINGVEVADILQNLMPYASADGANDAKRINKMQLNAISFAYEEFDSYFPLLYPPEGGQYELSIRNADQEEAKTITIEAMSRVERNQILDDRFAERPSSYEDTWEYRIIDERVGYLKLGTMVTWRFEMDWQKFLKEAFHEMAEKKIENLIIDIRGNEGGSDLVGQELAGYILREKCIVNNLQSRAKIDRVPNELKPYITTWDTSIYDISDELTPIEGGFFIYKNDRETFTVPAARKAFAGKVYLLGDASNSSATYYLRRSIAQCNAVSIVGTPSGGNLNGINGGTQLIFSLPHSRFEVDIPVVGNFSRTPQADEGLPVDILIEPSVEAIRAGKDGQLEGLLEMINP